MDSRQLAALHKDLGINTTSASRHASYPMRLLTSAFRSIWSRRRRERVMSRARGEQVRKQLRETIRALRQLHYIHSTNIRGLVVTGVDHRGETFMEMIETRVARRVRVQPRK